MFDFAFSEMLLTALVALIVLGPERLPHAAHRLGRLLGQIQSWSHKLRHSLDELPNGQAWQEMKDTTADLRQQMQELQNTVLPAWERLPEMKTPADFGIDTEIANQPIIDHHQGFHTLSLRRRALIQRRRPPKKHRPTHRRPPPNRPPEETDIT